MTRTVKYNGKGWNPINTVPRDTIVTLRTVRGIVCKGLVPKGEKIRKPDQRVSVKRINARRMDERVKLGDVRAVEWRA